jgi:hypothetical protein
MAVEAAFLVAVPTVVGVALHAGKWTIVAASGVAYLLIVLVEAFLWYGGAKRLPQLSGGAPRRPAQSASALQPETTVEEPSVVVRRAEPQAEAAEPEAPPQRQPQPQPQPQPAPAAPEHVRVLRREPEPEPVERAPLVAVPEPEPEPEPVAASAPAPAQPAAASTVVPIGVGSSPRRWNLWDLERATRESTGSDEVKDEERTFLLMYLREFADADGLLPVDFDGLVRDSFGDLVGAP